MQPYSTAFMPSEVPLSCNRMLGTDAHVFMQWLDRFLAACTGCRVDFIASHYCMPPPADLSRPTKLRCFSQG